jgi:hypothetical protein
MHPPSDEAGISAQPNIVSSSRSNMPYRLRPIVSGSGMKDSRTHSKIAD